MTAEPRSEDELLLQAAESFGWTAPRDHPFVYLVARDETEDDRLARGLEQNGFQVIRLPLLQTGEGRDAPRLPGILASLAPGTAIAWTSRRAAEILAASALPRRGAALQGVPLFAPGPASAEPMTRGGLLVSIPPLPLAGSARGLGDHIAARAAAEGIRRVLFLAGNRSLPDFPEALAARRIDLERLEVYETRFLSPDVREVEESLADHRLACAVFFSPSGAEALEALLPPPAVKALHRIPVAAKGPTTAAALRARGYRSVDAGLRTVNPRPSHPLAFLALHLMDETHR